MRTLALSDEALGKYVEHSAEKRCYALIVSG
jgi:hypothetical protein